MTAIENNYNREHPRKALDLHLPYFKQGDDLGHCLERTENSYEALIMDAKNLECAALILRKVAEEIKPLGDLIEIFADTHIIQVEGPEEFMMALMVKKIDDFNFSDHLEEDPFADEYEEEDEDYDDDLVDEEDEGIREDEKTK